MKNFSKIALTCAALMTSAAASADHHAGASKKDRMNAGNAPTMGWVTPGWGMIAPPPVGFGFIPPLPFAPIGIEGSDEMGAPVYDAKDPSKIIGYIKMRKAPKPTGPVHCMIKETGLLAKSVDDCEAAGGTVAK